MKKSKKDGCYVLLFKTAEIPIYLTKKMVKRHWRRYRVGKYTGDMFEIPQMNAVIFPLSFR